MYDLGGRTKNAERGGARKHSAEELGSETELLARKRQIYAGLDIRRAIKLTVLCLQLSTTLNESQCGGNLGLFHHGVLGA